nr:hypothetical protein [Marinicella sp. W31]MDC2878720.1 hypothetical protein [Marinicella sp. W31]
MFNASFPRIPADSAARVAETGDEALGHLPEWDLTHLYPGATSPAFTNAFDEAAKRHVPSPHAGKASLPTPPETAETMA